MLVEDDETQGCPYQWDNKLAELAQPGAPSIKMGAICISQWKCGGGEGDVTHDGNFNSDDRASHNHLQLVVQNTPAPLDVQRMLVLLNLADWQVPNQVAPRCYTTTVCINAWACDLHGVIPTAKCCWVTGTSTASKRTVY